MTNVYIVYIDGIMNPYSTARKAVEHVKRHTAALIVDVWGWDDTHAGGSYLDDYILSATSVEEVNQHLNKEKYVTGFYIDSVKAFELHKEVIY